MASVTIETPCRSVCEIDPSTGLCRGCLRSRMEIASWLSMGPIERRRIMAALPERADLLSPQSDDDNGATP